MDNGKRLPAWLDKLRAANGTEECPNADPSVNYFNYAHADKPTYGGRRRYEPPRFTFDDFDFDPFDDDDDDLALLRPQSNESKNRHAALIKDLMNDLEKTRAAKVTYDAACMVRCNMTGKPILHSLSELTRHGDKMLRDILDTKTGVMWTKDAGGVGRTYERKDTVFVDYTGYSELYCVAIATGDSAETVFRITVDNVFTTTLVAVTDPELEKRVIDIYKNKP